MGSGLTNVLLLFVVGFVVGYVVTRTRPQAIRVQAGLLLGFVLFVRACTGTRRPTPSRPPSWPAASSSPDRSRGGAGRRCPQIRGHARPVSGTSAIVGA